MTSRSWEDLVAEGVHLAEADPRDRWAIGDLCIEAVPPGTGKTERSAAQRRLAEFSAATHLPLGLLKDCYRTSEAWPTGSRFADISHARHSTYAARPDRINLLLNENMADGLSTRVRERVAKVEELLGDAAVRAAVLDRSHERNRRVVSAARAIEDEDLAKARTHQRIQEQDAKARRAAPEILGRMADRAIKGNLSLARMVTELLDLRTVVHHIPTEYHARTIENLTQIRRASELVLDILRPETRSPQPCDVIVIPLDEKPGAEHR